VAHLFYVVDWLPPDFGAVGQYGAYFAERIADGGRKVCLVGLTSGPPQRTRRAVGDGELELVRIPASSYDKSRTIDRLRWTLRANWRLLWEVVRRREASGTDLLFTGAPPFFLYFALLAKLLRRMRLTYRITDFYPEVMIAASDRPSRALIWLQRITWWARRRIDHFEALGLDQKRLLLAGGISPDRIAVKPDISPVTFTGRERPAPRPPQLAGCVTLLYSGNYGVPHEVETVVAGFIRHHEDDRGRAGLWLNATGRNADRVEHALRHAGVPVARAAPVPLDQLAGLLLAADAHLVTLRPAFWGVVLPSKIHACIASGRPIIFVGPESSDVHRLCVEAAADRYHHVEPGDAEAFAAALEHLAIARQPVG
jgi:hypothetical protein